MKDPQKLFLRSFSWGEANISWSVVIEEILYAAENMGHKVVLESTNGYSGMKYWDAKKGMQESLFSRDFIRNAGAYDIDLTYTVPQNFPDRFLKSSKCCMAIYAYESSIMPSNWTKFYHLVNYMLPPSQYVADMMERNGCPKEKIIVVPHGVDIDVFNPNVTPITLTTDKKVKFLCVGEPHYRKQIDKLLELYCKTFTSADDVCFILKTKIFKPGDEMKGFEIDLKPVLAKLHKKHGSEMPEIKVISKRLDSLASLFTACDAFALMTASEGWGMPFLEALACGLPVIAPRYGGQLQFLNDKNAFLTNCGTRRARVHEQYWRPDPKAIVGNPSEKDFARSMRQAYEEIKLLKDTAHLEVNSLGATVSQELCNIRAKYSLMKNNALATAQSLTWKNATQQIINLAR